jgi:hypothetical protein
MCFFNMQIHNIFHVHSFTVITSVRAFGSSIHSLVFRKTTIYWIPKSTIYPIEYKGGLDFFFKTFHKVDIKSLPIIPLKGILVSELLCLLKSKIDHAKVLMVAHGRYRT